MSLYIDTDQVTAVLLADGWHKVSESTFDLDAYEFHWNDDLILGGGRADGVCATGFSFIESGPSTKNRERISGPLTAVLAVKTKASA